MNRTISTNTCMKDGLTGRRICGLIWDLMFMRKIWFLQALSLLTALTAVAFPPQTSTNAPQVPGEPKGYTGTVVETINAATYTYVQVGTGKEKIWAAAPAFQVKVGDKVTVPPGLAMRNYQSKTLKRTFDTVYFVSYFPLAYGLTIPR